MKTLDEKLRTLTPRQREIFTFIRGEIAALRSVPSTREIGRKFGIKSPNGVVCTLEALEKKGLISRGDKKARSISLVDNPVDELVDAARAAVEAVGPYSETGARLTQAIRGIVGAGAVAS